MSATRVALLSFDDAELVKLIAALVKEDTPRWLPQDQTGRFLYVRPAIIGNGTQLGGETTRAWPGGFGYAKVGANYGTTFVAHGKALEQGFDQILWLFGPDGRVTEAGASNFFAVVKNEESGRAELLTASLDDNLILDGVTRRSVLELVRSRLSNELSVSETVFTMSELKKAWEQGRLLEAFVSGTAFFITPVCSINYEGRDLDVPQEHQAVGASYASVIKGWLKDIMYGGEVHPWGLVVED
ncbi:Branched-chain-amino-acid aminotransferase like protein [Verticillium longisporum]|uniref:Branched-chain-amino-acid aminotransferase n=1 Tax=Verticillium longisporum TaxID=100787 RepID=A0A8I2ZLN4_VERLO|nr:Branched-chain-amino-acid aminotransferase like protein [Verticillium longisporum]